jgi:hypothetical protein
MQETTSAKASSLMAATVAALSTLGPVAAFQCGLLRHLPDPPPSSLFDSDKITSSKVAHPLGIPDALLGLSSYGVTLTLILLSGRSSVARKLLPWKLAAEASIALFNFVRQVSVFSPVKEMEPADYKRVSDVLYLGFVYGKLSAPRRMLPRNRGTIIQIGLALSYRSIPLQPAYRAAKHAINGFTDSLRCELYHDQSNLKITNIQMPAMNTTQLDR